MEVFSALLGIIIAAGAGFYFGRNNSPDSQEKTRLETELKQKTDELEAFQNKVTNHFEKTANLFNQVSDSYQSLYDHMAHSSSQLCASQTFQSLPKSSKNRSGLSQTDSFHRAEQSHAEKKQVFSADALYNAYDYRNKQEDSDALDLDSESDTTILDAPLKKNNKVVDIESAKEDKNAPALDYAIKDKGVINHNSLNIDEVKTS